MSKFNQKTLVASVLTALLMSSSAFAFDGTFNAVTPATGSARGSADVRQSIATQLAQPFSLSSPVIVSTQVGDNIIGRTTGFQMRLELPADSGLVWDTAGNATTTDLLVGPALTSGTPWVVTISPASDGTRFLVFSVQPAVGSDAIIAGDIGNIVGLYFKTAGGGAPADNSLVDATLRAVDSNSSVIIGTEEMQLARFTDGLAVTCVATPENAAEFAKIDVKGDISPDAAKTDFVIGSPWAIGTGTATTANLGAINFAASAGVTFDPASTFGINVTPQSRTGVVSFGASNTADCALQFGVDATASVAGVYNVSFTGADAGTLAGATAESVFLCINVNGTSTLAAQTFLVNTAINGSIQPEACPVAPLNFNGSVVKVFNWNPSQNTRQESLVRIVNDGSVSGDVSIIGINDDGTQVGPIRFNLPRTHAVFLSAKDLETGVDDNTPGVAFTGSLGAATGKRRLEITGEFDRMIVQSYSRNGSTNTLSNTTDADTFEEQKAENKQ